MPRLPSLLLFTIMCQTIYPYSQVHLFKNYERYGIVLHWRCYLRITSRLEDVYLSTVTSTVPGGRIDSLYRITSNPVLH